MPLIGRAEVEKKRPFEMNIAIGRLWQETNSFSERVTELSDFQQYTFKAGQTILDDMQKQDDELAGFADVLLPEGVNCIPLLSASTWPGGTASEEVVKACRDAILEQLKMASGLDAILFSFHGAMAGLSVPDVEGYFLNEMRKAVGTDLPIVITLDHHANVTKAMVEASDALVAYHHCPHTDMRETGCRGARLLLSILNGKTKPAMAYCKIPLVTPCECFRTANKPLKTWFDKARAMERAAEVADISLYPVQPWLDVPEFGWSVVVVTNDNQALAESLCEELANDAWINRDKFFVKKYEPEEAIKKAAESPQGPIVIADGADATNGGSPGDSTCLLREMLAQKIDCVALLTLVDPDTVEKAYQAGQGARLNVRLGATYSRRYHQPVEAEVKVKRFSTGEFDISGHIAMHVNMGRCALLEIGSIKIVVSEKAGPGHDPGVFRQIGLDPEDAQIVVVKCTVGHMDAYKSIMKESLPCECPGPSPSYLERLDYRQIPRPIYPFDRDIEWSPESTGQKPSNHSISTN